MTDLLGRPLTDDETELLDLYQRVRRLLRDADLAPCTYANLQAAGVGLWNAANDLALDIEPY